MEPSQVHGTVPIDDPSLCRDIPLPPMSAELLERDGPEALPGRADDHRVRTCDWEANDEVPPARADSGGHVLNEIARPSHRRRKDPIGLIDEGEGRSTGRR